MKTAIHFGADALGRLKDIPYKRVLVVTDPFVVKSGMIDMITKPLQAGGKEFDIFCDVVPDAPVGKIAEGVKKFLDICCIRLLRNKWILCKVKIILFPDLQSHCWTGLF